MKTLERSLKKIETTKKTKACLDPKVSFLLIGVMMAFLSGLNRSWAHSVSFPVETFLKTPQTGRFENVCLQGSTPLMLECQVRGAAISLDVIDYMHKLQDLDDPETRSAFSGVSSLQNTDLKRASLRYLYRHKEGDTETFAKELLDYIFTEDNFFGHFIHQVFNDVSTEPFASLQHSFAKGHPSEFFNEEAQDKTGYANGVIAQNEADDMIGLLDGVFPGERWVRMHWFDYYDYSLAQDGSYTPMTKLIKRATWTSVDIQDLRARYERIPQAKFLRPKAQAEAELEDLQAELDRLGKLIQQGHREYMPEFQRKMAEAQTVQREVILWTYVPDIVRPEQTLLVVVIDKDPNNYEAVDGAMVFDQPEFAGHIVLDFKKRPEVPSLFGVPIKRTPR